MQSYRYLSFLLDFGTKNISVTFLYISVLEQYRKEAMNKSTKSIGKIKQRD